MIDAREGKINRVIGAKKTPRQLLAAEVLGSTGLRIAAIRKGGAAYRLKATTAAEQHC